MHLVCPHCTTSYAVDPATLGAAGRTVRCSRCKGVWLARPEDGAAARIMHPALAEAGARSAKADVAAEWEALAREESDGAPIVDSPSIADGGPNSTDLASPTGARHRLDDEDGQDSRTAPLANSYRATIMAPAPADPADASRSLRPAVDHPAGGLRRHGRAGARLDDLALRRGAPAAADRRVLQTGGTGR